MTKSLFAEVAKQEGRRLHKDARKYINLLGRLYREQAAIHGRAMRLIESIDSLPKDEQNTTDVGILFGILVMSRYFVSCDDDDDDIESPHSLMDEIEQHMVAA